MTKGLFLSLLAGLTSSPQTTTDFLTDFLDRLSQVFTYNTLNLGQPAGLLFFFACFIIIFFSWKKLTKKEKQAIFYLLILILSSSLLFLFAGNGISFIMLGLATPVIALSSFSLVLLFKRQKLITTLLLVLVIITNLIKITQVNQQTTPIFAIQENMTLENEKRVIDLCYRLTEGQPFSLNTITNPLFINTTWAYLFQWCGQTQYDYLPTWSGISQQGNLGEKIFTQDEEETGIRILIIEPTNGLPKTWIEASIQEENLHSEIIKEEKVDHFLIQLRQKIPSSEREVKLREVNLLRKKPADALLPSEKALLHIYDLRNP